MADLFSIEGLRYAQAAGQTKSFSAAARAYGVTQPALSNVIAKLEERLGAKLFERTTRGVVPSAFGSRILPLIDSALAAIDSVSAEASRLTDTGERRISLGVSPLISPELVARAFAAVRTLPAPRDLVLHEANMADLRAALETGKLDAALVPAVDPLPRFAHRVIQVEPVVVTSSEAGDGPVDVDAVGASELILVPDACGLTTFTTRLLAEREIPLRTYPGEAASYSVLERWAQLGLGTAILPESKLSSPDVRRQPLLVDGEQVYISYEAVWSQSSPLAADIAELVQAIAV